MCLIVNFEPKYEISEALMENFAKRNDDGFGFMWIEDNRLRHLKFGPDQMDDLYPIYQSVKHCSGFLHLRMRTHGNTDQEMAHPFDCGFGIYLMHNGVLDDKGTDKTKSDTWHFANNILAPLFRQAKNPHRLMRTDAFNDLLHKYLGYSNRIVLGDRGGFTIFNRSSWHTIANEATGCKGMLVSNTYAWDAENFGKPKKTYHYNYNTNGRSFGDGIPNPHLPTTMHQTTDDDDDDDRTTVTHYPARRRTPIHTPERQAQFEAWIASHFYHLGREWYSDASGKVFKKRLDHGLDRRADLDDNEQFWNTFDKEKLASLGLWIGDKNNTEYTNVAPAASLRGEPQPPAPPRAAQLIQNWANQSPDQIKEDIKKYPEQAAEAVVALTHEPVKQIQ